MDIPEGAEISAIPRFGYGRILSAPEIGERYVTACLAGYRVFVAWGKYGKSTSMRYWVKHV